MLPKLIINISLLSGCSATNIAALPDAILSLYFSIAFSFLITLDLTVIESPILAENDENIISFFLFIKIFYSKLVSFSFLNL